MLFAAYLGRGNTRAAGTILAYLSCVKTHAAMTLGVEMASGRLQLKRLAQGIRRLHSAPRRVCHGLRAAHLQAAFARGVGGGALNANLWAMIVFGWTVLARPLELIELTRASLIFTGPDNAVVCIQPKKKKAGTQPVPIPLTRGDGGATDAFTALEHLELTDPVASHQRRTTALFRGTRGARLRHVDVTNAVRAVVAAGGESVTATFSGRSLRVGGATELAARGVDPLTIRLLGRWDSGAYQAYTRVSHGRAVSSMAAMGRSAPRDPTLESLFAGYSQAP